MEAIRNFNTNLRTFPVLAVVLPRFSASQLMVKSPSERLRPQEPGGTADTQCSATQFSGSPEWNGSLRETHRPQLAALCATRGHSRGPGRQGCLRAEPRVQAYDGAI